MSSDLVGGSYPVTNEWWSSIGKPVNATQSNLAARSNVYLFGPNALTDTAAALVNTDLTWVPVPVEYGDPISIVDVLVGATAASTPTHQFAALYNATGKKIVASADGTTHAIAASARYSFTLAAVHIVTPTDAPNGWLFAAVSVTGTTVPSLLTVGGTVAAAGQYKWFSTGPAIFAAHGAATTSGAKLPATLPSATKNTAVPVVFLR